MRKELCVLVLVVLCGTLSCAIETTGNQQLRNAINAAIAEMAVSNEWFPISQGFPGVGLHTYNCPQATEYAAYPASPVGTFANILSTGKVTFGVSYTFPPISFVNSSGIVDGFEPRLFTRIVQRISTRYNNTKIAIEWVNTDGYSLLERLANGAVDGLVHTVVPGQFNETTRTTITQVGNQACSHLLNGIGLLSGPSFTRGTLSLSTINSRSVKVGTYASSNTLRAELKNLAPSCNTGTTYWAPSREVLFGWLADGTIDVVADYSATLNFQLSKLGSPSTYQFLDLGVYHLKAFSTRRDVTQTPVSDRVHAVDGNEQMYFAFQAFLSNYYASGAWEAARSAHGLGSGRVQTCVPDTTWYPYPNFKDLLPGTLRNVLKSRTLNMCHLSAKPYFYLKNGKDAGFYYEVMTQFAAALSKQYKGVGSIATTFRVAVETPTFNSIYNGSCHGFIGSFIPGSLGLINNTYTTTATRLYQSCAVHSDIVSVIAGPAFDGDFTLQGLNSPSVSMISVVGTTTTRNAVKTVIPLAKYNATSQSIEEAYADLEAGRSKLIVTQRGIANAFIANSANPSSYRTLELPGGDQLLYSVVFYKPENGTETSAGQPNAVPASILVVTFLLIAALF